MAARWWMPSASEEKVSLPPPPSRKLCLTNTKVGPGTGAEVPPQTGGTPQRRRKLKVMTVEYKRNQLNEGAPAGSRLLLVTLGSLALGH